MQSWHQYASSCTSGTHIYVPTTEGEGEGVTYCFWCRSCQRLSSFLIAHYLVNPWMNSDHGYIIGMGGNK